MIRFQETDFCFADSRFSLLPSWLAQFDEGTHPVREELQMAFGQQPARDRDLKLL